MACVADGVGVTAKALSVSTIWMGWRVAGSETLSLFTSMLGVGLGVWVFCGLVVGFRVLIKANNPIRLRGTA